MHRIGVVFRRRNFFSTRPPPVFPKPAFDFEYFGNPENKNEILHNLMIRDIPSEVFTSFLEGSEETVHLLPNKTHPEVAELKEPKVIHEKKWVPPEKLKKIRSFDSLSKSNCRNTDLTPFCGERAYYLTGQLAELERALIRFTVQRLKREFTLISVPDILDPRVIAACGMDVDSRRTQIYRLKKDDLALSGTAEMALGGFFMNTTHERTRKVASVSRCFRAEVSSSNKGEGGIYRVHNFTKVEMFAVTSSDESEKVLESFLETQRNLFDELGLFYRVLDMSPDELGLPAFRKYDIEALMPSKKRFGEISSCSNCTDFQSRRLNIQFSDSGFAHTVNGTACAVPRMIMAIIEQFQLNDKRILIPDKLRQFMRNAKYIDNFSKPIFKFRSSPYFHMD